MFLRALCRWAVATVRGGESAWAAGGAGAGRASRRNRRAGAPRGSLYHRPYGVFDPAGPDILALTTSIRARPSVPGKKVRRMPRAMDAPASPPDRKRRRRDSPHTLPPIRQLYLPNTADPAPFGVYPQYSLPPMAVEQDQYDSEGEDADQRGPPKKKRRRQALSCTGNASAWSCALS